VTVLAADTWPTNADLIAAAASLHFDHIDADGIAIDLTYGHGNWWTKWRPLCMWTNDINPDRRCDSRHDYRKPLPFPTDHFDLVAFDPPYQSQGGRTTSTVPGMNSAYGRNLSAKTPAENQQWINLGITEAVRLCRPKGVVLVKVMDYITSGKLWLGTHRTLTHVESLPVEVEALYTHVGQPGPQPTANPDGTPRRQVHPRNNASTLLVLRKQANRKENRP
jgi:hypothetical protein